MWFFQILLRGTLSAKEQVTFKAEKQQFIAKKWQEKENLKKNDQVKVFEDMMAASIEYDEMQLEQIKSEMAGEYIPWWQLEQDLKEKEQQLAEMVNCNQEIVDCYREAKGACICQISKNKSYKVKEKL